LLPAHARQAEECVMHPSKQFLSLLAMMHSPKKSDPSFMQRIRSLHWALRLLIFLVASVGTIALIVQLSGSEPDSLNGARGLQHSWLLAGLVVPAYAVLLFGGNGKED
jgi:hypothetical protein